MVQILEVAAKQALTQNWYNVEYYVHVSYKIT